MYVSKGPVVHALPSGGTLLLTRTLHAVLQQTNCPVIEIRRRKVKPFNTKYESRFTIDKSSTPQIQT